MGDGGGSDLRRGLEALKIFQKRVNDALKDFEGSPGASSSIAQHALDRASFSGEGIEFDEAQQLFQRYDHVHGRLKDLSNSLGLHIDALGIAVQAADVGYDNVDEEVRRRFWAIQTRLDQELHKAVPDKKPVKPAPEPKANKATDGGNY